MDQVAFVPITKIDVEKREVWGVLAEEAPDKSGEIFDYESSKPLFEAWSGEFEKATEGKSKGNVRAMHGNVAAGKLTAIGFDDAQKNMPVAAKIVDENEWTKCQEGVYTGFSIGGKYVKRWKDDGAELVRYTAEPSEVSLVDNPCMHGAMFTAVKADGTEELRKFKGAVEKDAAAAVAQANDAIAALKAMAVELLKLPGEPSTWTIDQILEGMRSAISAKIDAESKAAAEGTPAPEAGPEEPAAVAAAADGAGLKKNNFEGQAAEGGLLESQDDELLPMLKKLETAMTAQAENLKAVQDSLGKTVGETVTKAVDAAKEELQKTITAIEERVAKVENQPAPPGRPVSKKIGAEDGSGGNAAEVVEKAIKAAEEAGASQEVLSKMRLEAAQALMQATT